MKVTEVIHHHVGIISRAKGRSAVSAAAYRAAEKLRNERNGLMHDYTNKRDVVYKQILLPKYAREEFKDRKILWNAVEKIEKAKNSRTARELRVYLYDELEPPEQIRLIVDHVQESFVNRGMCADVCIHDKGNGNPHAHVMLTTRSLDANGNWMGKQRKNYILDKDGKKIYDPVKKQYKCGPSIKTNDWDNEGNVEKWRQEWARACNRAFERKGLEHTVTHESYALQSSDLEPTIHLGPRVSALKRRGIFTDRAIENNAIIEKREHESQRQQERSRSRGRSR